MPIYSVNLGFSYVPDTIRAWIGSSKLIVDEVDPIVGRFNIEVPSGRKGIISIDYQRRLFQGGGPKKDRILGKSDTCIYCGSASALSKEHIIPYALEGDFIIEDGSCKSCAAETGRFEQKVLRDALLAPRTALKLRTRRPKERPTSFPLLRKVDGVERVINVPAAVYPSYLALPLLALPAYLRGDDSPNLKIIPPGSRLILVSAATNADAARQIGEEAVGVRIRLNIYAFARMLAKIAHGFVAVADCGAVECFLPGPMFAKDESIGRWVGGAPDITVPAEGTHGVRIDLVDGELHVRIRLFAQLGGPEYLVVAGRLIEPSSGARPFATVESTVSH